MIWKLRTEPATTGSITIPAKIITDDRGAHIRAFTFSSQDHGRLPDKCISKRSQKLARSRSVVDCALGFLCGVCVHCLVRVIHSTACLSRRVPAMHPIGWQNTWEQAPGVPATPSPPWWRGNPWPCTCVHGPKKRHASGHVSPVQETQAEKRNFHNLLQDLRHGIHRARRESSSGAESTQTRRKVGNSP